MRLQAVSKLAIVPSLQDKDIDSRESCEAKPRKGKVEVKKTSEEEKAGNHDNRGESLISDNVTYWPAHSKHYCNW